MHKHDYEWEEVVGHDIFESCTRLVEEHGDAVGMHSPACMERRLAKNDKDTCHGCEYALGCAKLSRILIASLVANSVLEQLGGEPYSPAFIACGKWGAYVSKQILVLKSVEEVHAFKPDTPMSILEG